MGRAELAVAVRQVAASLGNQGGARRVGWASQRAVHGRTVGSECVDSPSMKKLLIILALVALAAVAAKKVRTV